MLRQMISLAIAALLVTNAARADAQVSHGFGTLQPQPGPTTPPTPPPPPPPPPACPPPACVDPETIPGSYVSIGVMPAPYRISWESPIETFASILVTGFAGRNLDRSHSIGHVLLKVRCGTDAPQYISQTGASAPTPIDEFWQLRDAYVGGPHYFFQTHSDGRLYPHNEALLDWVQSIGAQMSLGADGTYTTAPSPNRMPGVLWAPRGMNAVRDRVAAMRPLARHRFVRATIRINEAQCRAILTWRDAYDAIDPRDGTRGSSRYSVHRAPWIRDVAGKYDGGGCSSVSFAGAFYAAGLDYKRVATRLTVQLEIGTARLFRPIVRDNRSPNGWFLLQNRTSFVPGNVPCAEENGRCIGRRSWDDPIWRSWSGGIRADGAWLDTSSFFAKTWSFPRRPIRESTVPILNFDPEFFYNEIRSAWNDIAYDAFTYRGWCKIPGKVPVIVLDARTFDGPNHTLAGRPQGLINGFDNIESKLKR